MEKSPVHPGDRGLLRTIRGDVDKAVTERFPAFRVPRYERAEDDAERIERFGKLFVRQIGRQVRDKKVGSKIARSHRLSLSRRLFLKAF